MPACVPALILARALSLSRALIRALDFIPGLRERIEIGR